MGQGYAVNFDEPYPLIVKLTLFQVGLDFFNNTLGACSKPLSRDNHRKGLIHECNNGARLWVKSRSYDQFGRKNNAPFLSRLFPDKYSIGTNRESIQSLLIK